MALAKILFLIAYTSALSVNYVPESRTPPPQRELLGLAHDSTSNKVYIYGGRSEVIHGDMWEFDLTTKSWNEIHTASVISPGARSAAYLTILEESSQIVLFGGDTESGPISDVWLYDIDSEIVKFIQWQLIVTTGKAPPRAYYRTVCAYMHEGKHYLAVYGGKDNRTNYVTSLHM